jgi:mono/diheme cytochrome c family protein
MPSLIRITSVCLALVAVGSGLASASRLSAPSDDLPAGAVMVATLSPFRPFAPAAAGPIRSGFRLFDQADQTDGQRLFQTRCFVCHGRSGKGDGPAVTGLAEKPQDLTDANWQRNTPDDRIHTVIQGGGVAIGKSGAMPPNPDLTQEQIQGLISFVRSLGTH